MRLHIFIGILCESYVIHDYIIYTYVRYDDIDSKHSLAKVFSSSCTVHTTHTERDQTSIISGWKWNCDDGISVGHCHVCEREIERKRESEQVCWRFSILNCPCAHLGICICSMSIIRRTQTPTYTYNGWCAFCIGCCCRRIHDTVLRSWRDLIR